jgi:PAS domain S-box-containing protein
MAGLAQNAPGNVNFASPGAPATAQLEELDFFRSVAGNIKGFLYRCAADESYTMLNMTPGFAAMTGFPLSDMLNNAVRTFASLIHPDDIAEVDAAVARAFERRDHWEVNYRLKCADGSFTWVKEKGCGIWDASSTLIYAEGFVVDASELRLAEQRNAALTSRLGAIVGAANGIAKLSQTLKMLALNARIEAQRAGPYGRGFDVVASEMRSLAQETEDLVSGINREAALVKTTMNT